MKKLLSIVVVAVLVAGLLPTAAFAGSYTGIDGGVTSLLTASPQNINLTAAAPGATLQINPDLLLGAENYAPQESLTGLAIVVDTVSGYSGQQVFDSLFPTKQWTVTAVDGTQNNKPTGVALALTSGNLFHFDATYQFRIRFQSGGVTTAAYQDITVTQTAKNGAVDALVNYTHPEQTINAGENFTIPLSNYVSPRNGGTLPGNWVTIYSMGVTQNSQQGNCTVTLEGANLKVTAANNLTPGGYTIAATVAGKTSDGNNAYQAVSIPVKISQPPATVTGVVAGSGIAWSLPASGKLTTGDTLTVTFGQSNFGGVSQGRDLSNFQNEIKSYFSISSTAGFGTPSWTFAPDAVRVDLPAVSAANTPGFQIKLSDGVADSAVKTANLVIEVPVVDATLTGVANNTALSGGVPATLAPGTGSFAITMGLNNFQWSSNQNRKFDAAKLATIQSWATGLPDASHFTPSWSFTDSTVTLRLTATQNTGTRTINFRLSGGGGTSQAVSGTVSVESDATLTGVANNTALSGGVPATLAPGTGSFAITMGLNNFQWSSNQNRKFDAAKLATIQSWATGLPDASHFTPSWSFTDSTVTLRLTATQNTGTRIINFRLSGGGGTSQAVSGTVNVQSAGTITGNKITDIHGGSYLGDQMVLEGKAFTGDPADLEVKPGQVLYLDFDSDFFVWENGQPAPAANVTSSLLNRGKIAVKVSKRTGGDVIDSVTLVNEGGRARIKIEFDEDFNNLKEKKFAATVYFTVNGKRHNDSQLEIAGIIENETQEAWDGETFYDMEDAPVLEVNDTIRNAELYVGNGLTIHTNLQKNRKYYAATSNDYTSADEEVMNKNNAVVDAIRLNTTNIPSTAKVSFDTDEKYYVYNEDGKYLGTTDEKLALSDVYYLSTRRVSLSVDNSTSVIEDPNSPAPSGPPSQADTGSSTSTGGGTGGAVSGGTSSPGSYNPPTGLPVPEK